MNHFFCVNLQSKQTKKMNNWTQLSIEYANQKSYLDDLFRIYPTIPEGIRDIDQNIWSRVERAYNSQDN